MNLYHSPLSFVRSIFTIIKSMRRICFSLVIADSIKLEKGARIGHFNIIIVKDLYLGKKARIGHFNFIKGFFDLVMEDRAEINLQNKISRSLSPKGNYCKAKLHLKYHAKIGVKHLLDMTSNITMGENSMLAGADSQLWTHGFYFSKEGEKTVRIDGDIEIGHNCYIGSRCVVLAGVCIGDSITIGANSCISKTIMEQGCYGASLLDSFLLIQIKQWMDYLLL